MHVSSVETTARPTIGAPLLRCVVERTIHLLLFGCASISVLTTLGIVVVLLTEAVQFFLEVSIFEFLTGTKWTPLLKPQHFGILPLLSGSLIVACGSALIAIPLGLGTAISSRTHPAHVKLNSRQQTVVVPGGIASI